MNYQLDFEVNNDGKYMTVLIFDDYVVKFAKSNACKNKDLERMAKLQTEVSQQVDGVYPLKKIDNVLIMQRAKGKRADYYREDRKMRDHIKRLMDRKKKEIKELGYKITDVSWKNCFYDEETDSVSIIDMHQIKKEGGE